MDRRKFIKHTITAAAASSFAPPLFSISKSGRAAGERLNLAFIGTGLMGGVNMRILLQQHNQRCAAVCDVDSKYSEKNILKYAPNAPRFVDYREMFDKMGGKLDGVVVSTPDNSHFAIAMAALKRKLPVYLEKPLCHTIWQTRALTQAAARAGVATQMGNFVHSSCGIDCVREWVGAGAIGDLKEVVAWTCRPLKGCNQPPRGWKSWPKPDPIPPALDWDKWLNTTEYCDYYDAVVPLNWRRFFKFGSGSLGDIGCHILDVPITAFNLPAPAKVEVSQRGGTSICVPLQDKITYHFPTGPQNKPLKITWYSGFLQPDESGKFPAGYDASFLPPLPGEFTDMKRGYKNLSNDGMFIIGSEGVIYSPAMHLLGKPVLLPKSRAAAMRDVLDAKTRGFATADHRLNFVKGITGEVKRCNSDFSVAGPLTETIQLGNVVLQLGKNIAWDSANMKAVGEPAADAFINPPMRSGWY